jgi:dipeptide transport system substrate-binding protein
MNADDVVFSFNRMADPANSYHDVDGATYEMFSDFIAPALKSVRRISDDTVAFDLKTPSASLLSALTVQSFSIWSAEYAAAMEKAGTKSQVDLAPLGTGPFQLVQYQKDQSVRFRAFRPFWGTTGGMPQRAAKVDNLVFAITPDSAVRLAKLRANECQIDRYPNPADLDSMSHLPGITVLAAPAPAQSMLSFRTDKAPYSDLRVRQALVMAIDHDNLVKTVFQQTGVPSSALVPAALWGHDADLPPYPYDPAAAKALLTAAGYPNGFAVDLWTIPVTRAYMPNGRRAAEVIQADWAKIGVKAKVVTYEWGEFLRRRRAGDADVAMNGGTWDYPDPSELTQTQTCAAIADGSNVSHWCNKTYSDLIHQADVVTDQAARAKLYEQAQVVFRDQLPSMIFADVKGFGAVRDSVQGYKLHFLGGQPFSGVSLAK